MIKENLSKILTELSPDIKLVVATKARTISEIEEAILSGISIIGENYVKEAQDKFKIIGNKVDWHLLGHLQKNKAKIAVKIFNMIETLDSKELAETLDKECKKINKIMPVLIEVNSANEAQKSGVLPDKVKEFLKSILEFNNLKPQGLMTMGPLVDNPESLRPFFKKTKEVFDKIGGIYGSNLDWKYLSMGMSDSYRIAIEEGANMVRIGTAIFGKRI